MTKYGIISFGVVLVFGNLITGSNAAIQDRLKNDFFHIYKNIALETRDIQNKPVTPDKINFFLFTRENPNEYVRLDPGKLDRFHNKTVKLIFLIHGWTNSRETPWYEDVKNAFLHRDDEFYVVQVDWKEPADQLYTVSSINTYDVAKIIAKLIEDLHKEQNIPLNNILLVGHSLGGQICGFVGKHIQKNTGKKLPRIIALDPAGPLFSQRPDDKRLNKNDAEYVEVVHTDGGSFGFQNSCGTIDFFVNGGSSQPGCRQIDLADITSVSEPLWCDHQRAYEYFSEAILNPQVFVAKKCSSWAKFKDNKCDKEEAAIGDLRLTLQGNFYLETNKERPFAKKTSSNEGGFSILKLLQH